MLTCDNISIRECFSLRAIQKRDCDEFHRKNIPLNVLSISTVGDCYRVAPLNYLPPVVQQRLAKFIVFIKVQ